MIRHGDSLELSLSGNGFLQGVIHLGGKVCLSEEANYFKLWLEKKIPPKKGFRVHVQAEFCYGCDVPRNAFVRALRSMELGRLQSEVIPIFEDDVLVKPEQLSSYLIGWIAGIKERRWLMIQLNEVLFGVVFMMALGFLVVSVYMALTEDARQAKRKALSEKVDSVRSVL